MAHLAIHEHCLGTNTRLVRERGTAAERHTKSLVHCSERTKNFTQSNFKTQMLGSVIKDILEL